MSVHFYCTRCRHLLKYPQSKSGMVIYCPFCQQAIIVPTLLFSKNDSDFDNDLQERSAESGLEIDQKDSNNRWAISNHLTPKINLVSSLSSLDFEEERLEKTSENLIDQSNNAFFEDQNRIESAESSALSSKESQVVKNGALKMTPIKAKSLTDQEFWHFLHSTPTDPLYKPPVVSSSTEEKELLSERKSSDIRNSNYWNEKLNQFLMIAVIIVAIIGLGTLGKIIFGQYYRKAKPDLNQAMTSEIFVDGRLTYNDAKQRLQGDEGSIVFLIPENFPQEIQLVLGELSARQPDSVLPKESERKLRENGGYFARADANGYFDFVISKAGKYKLFLISAHLPLQNIVNEEKLQELNRFFYRPDRSLLKNSRFIWDDWQLDENNRYIEYSFGN